MTNTFIFSIVKKESIIIIIFSFYFIFKVKAFSINNLDKMNLAYRFVDFLYRNFDILKEQI